MGATHAKDAAGPPCGPALRLDLDKIEANTRALCSRLPALDIVGVVKAVCGHPDVARAMVAGGATAIGDSRIENLERLTQASIAGPAGKVPLWLLRAPVPGQADRVVRTAAVSLNSEIDTLRALEAAAGRAGRRHSVLLMVDLGDLREGALPEEVRSIVEAVAELPHLQLAGLGTNLTCYGGVVPTPENLGLLVKLARRAESRLPRGPGNPFFIVSGGNSSSLDLAFSDRLPAGVTGLRVGESILLGTSTVTGLPLPGLHQDAFVLEAPVIECRTKPSYPVGETTQNGLPGRRPPLVDRGPRLRALCALGRQDCVPEGLTPLEAGVRVLGASSDHLILDVEDMERRPRVGDSLHFAPTYGALLAAATSPYVRLAPITTRRAGA